MEGIGNMSSEENLKETFKLTDSLRGKNIFSERIIPTVCSVKIMLDKLREVAGEYANLKQWEKRSYKNYNIEEIKNQLLLADEEERISLLRKHILENDFSFLGANPFDIYIVAYVAENIGTGRTTFIDFCLKNGMAGTEKSANAIYQVGRSDGIYLNILNEDGTVKDWKFFKQWMKDDKEHFKMDKEQSKTNVYNKLVRDDIPKVIMESGKSCVIRRVDSEEKRSLLMDKLNEEVQEFFEAENLEELADIMEVLFGLASGLGYSEEDLMKLRVRKREARGGFEQGILLEKVCEK
jgi:predicted house-cleaning noncanonical NTP pyrophosphatase (MazG superfamily)